MPHIVRNARAPPATPEAYGCSKHTDASSRAGDRRGGKMPGVDIDLDKRNIIKYRAQSRSNEEV